MIGWVIETLAATTLLMLLVLLVRRQVAQVFGPHMAYALWLLPVLRLLLPPLPGEWQLSRLLAPVTRDAVDGPGVAMGLLDADRLSAQIADAAIAQAQIELAGHQANVALVAPTAAQHGPTLAMLLVGLWVLGALAFLAYHLVAHSRHCRTLLSRARIDRTVAQGRVRVIETDAAHGPLAFGIFRKYVAFPRDFAERYDPVERDLALAHELGHHARGDLFANWVALVVLALHWFNPVAWRAFRAFRADQEMACDALVLAGRAQALRHAYGRAIVKSAHGGAVSAACHLHTINEVKGRLRMLSKNRPFSPARVAAGLIGVGTLSVGALALTASGTQAAEQIRSKVTAVAGVVQDMPVPPAPPAAPAAPAPLAAPAPAAAPLPPLPPAPPEPPEAVDGKGKRHVYRVTEDKDGKKVTRTIVVNGDGELADLDRDLEKLRVHMPEIDIHSRNCGGKGPTSETRQEGNKRITIICTDRIAMVTADARRAAMDARMGRHHAMMGLRTARRTVEREPNLSEDQRAKALKGIDEAIRELESERSGED